MRSDTLMADQSQAYLGIYKRWIFKYNCHIYFFISYLSLADRTSAFAISFLFFYSFSENFMPGNVRFPNGDRNITFMEDNCFKIKCINAYSCTAVPKPSNVFHIQTTELLIYRQTTQVCRYKPQSTLVP